VPAILATARTDVTTMFVSFSSRHPEGRDAEYIEWHSLDHRPEQHRLAALRASLRLVSTPACRAARAVSSERYDAVDHVMSYFFADIGGLERFGELSAGLRAADRIPALLPVVERDVFRLEGLVASPRIKVGGDVLPWWPMRGVYLLVEQGAPTPASLTEVPGVGGAWWASGVRVDPHLTSTDSTGLQITYLYLDEDPAETGIQLRAHLDKRWSASGITPLLAAPFHTISNYDWARYIP
jgi:hypothetical protein